MKCDSCFHKEICTHCLGIKDGTYGAMRYNFDPEECTNYVVTAASAPVVHGHWCFGEFNVICAPVWCSVCGEIQGNVCSPQKWVDYPFHQFCGRCGAKMDGDKNAELP